MLNIVWMLFVAWFLNLFGFGNVVIKGLQQLGGPAITMTGYYFIFAAAGLIKNILYTIRRSVVGEVVKEWEKDN